MIARHDPLAAGAGLAMQQLVGALARHAGANLPAAAVMASQDSSCRLYVSQAGDILRDLHMPTLDVLRTARNAVHDHVLFDGPHDRPNALLEHSPSQDLFAAVLDVPGWLMASHIAELRRSAAGRGAERRPRTPATYAASLSAAGL